MRFTFCLAWLLLCLVAAAQADSGENPAADYPGLSADGSVYLYAPGMIQGAVRSYFELNGTWPVSWQAVVDEGLCQVPLKTSEGSIINPGDAHLDFYEDVFYHYRGLGSPPEIIAMYDWSGRTVQATPLQGDTPVKTMRQILDNYGQFQPAYAEYCSMPGIIKRHVVLSQIKFSQRYFYMVKLRAPASFTELLESGLCPYNAESINPLSGSRFVDGEGPFGVQIIPHAERSRAPEILMYDEDGLPVPLIG